MWLLCCGWPETEGIIQSNGTAGKQRVGNLLLDPFAESITYQSGGIRQRVIHLTLGGDDYGWFASSPKDT